MRVEQGSKRVRAYLDGELVADSAAPLLVWERPYYPTYYLPEADVRAKLSPAGPAPARQELGDGESLHVTAGSRTADGAAARYPAAPDERVRGAIRLEWSAMTEWLEEDEPVYTHPRDPHTRVDILASSRQVRVELDGMTVAESRRPVILFETGLPPRFYLPLPDLRMDLLVPSPAQTHCPYKGTASYWSVRTPTRLHQDLVWIYRSPLPESQKIAGLACFYQERSELYLDGQRQSRPRTPFS
jgi:uncharacterized protein (DUF427 family)